MRCKHIAGSRGREAPLPYTALDAVYAHAVLARGALAWATIVAVEWAGGLLTLVPPPLATALSSRAG